MLYKTTVQTPLGCATLACAENALIGLWLAGQRYECRTLPREGVADEPDHPILRATRQWLEDYFAGRRPDGSRIPLAPGGTDFQKRVWAELCALPYGELTTYGALARALGAPSAARAVGSAVGRNPIVLLIPCHRVLGSGGRLGGYAGGTERKRTLLRHEGVKI